MNFDPSSLQHFYYHKIGAGNTQAKQWIEGKNPLGVPATVIFFGEVSLDDIRQGEFRNNNQLQISQIEAFVKSGLPDRREQTCIIVVSKKVWFLRPTGEIQELPRIQAKGYSDTSSLKMMPVETITEKELNRVPLNLASIGSNQNLVRGTYRPISRRGNLKAIYHVLKKKWDEAWYQGNDPSNLFECLSSVELETLVAKILEESGCFVPAYRGGVLRHVDLFAYHDRGIDIDGLFVSPSGIQVQIKGGATSIKGLSDGVQLAGYGFPSTVSPFNEDWLLKQVKQLPGVQTWLLRSLDWVPQDYMQLFF